MIYSMETLNSLKTNTKEMKIIDPIAKKIGKPILKIYLTPKISSKGRT